MNAWTSPSFTNKPYPHSGSPREEPKKRLPPHPTSSVLSPATVQCPSLAFLEQLFSWLHSGHTPHHFPTTSQWKYASLVTYRSQEGIFPTPDAPEQEKACCNTHTYLLSNRPLFYNPHTKHATSNSSHQYRYILNPSHDPKLGLTREGFLPSCKPLASHSPSRIGLLCGSLTPCIVSTELFEIEPHSVMWCDVWCFCLPFHFLIALPRSVCLSLSSLLWFSSLLHVRTNATMHAGWSLASIYAD
jgi:hypothetical protein